MSRILPVPNITNNGAGATAVIDCPVGDMAYRDVIVAMGATSGSFNHTHLEGLRVVLDGDVTQRFLSGEDFKALQDFYGEQSAPTSQVRFGFTRNHLRQAGFSDLFAQGVRGLTSFQLELDIESGAASGGDPTLACSRRTFSRATPDRPNGNAPGAILRVIPYQQTVSSSGDHDFIGLLKSGSLIGLHVKGQGDITGVELELEDRRRWKVATDAVHETFVESSPKTRTRQTNWWHLDFMEQDTLDDQLIVRNANDLRLTVTTSDAENLVVYAMYLETYTPAGG